MSGPARVRGGGRGKVSLAGRDGLRQVAERQGEPGPYFGLGESGSTYSGRAAPLSTSMTRCRSSFTDRWCLSIMSPTMNPADEQPDSASATMTTPIRVLMAFPPRGSRARAMPQPRARPAWRAHRTDQAGPAEPSGTGPCPFFPHSYVSAPLLDHRRPGFFIKGLFAQAGWQMRLLPCGTWRALAI